VFTVDPCLSSPPILTLHHVFFHNIPFPAVPGRSNARMDLR
jgi:hypothetical protein